jgi:hypothetical protein
MSTYLERDYEPLLDYLELLSFLCPSMLLALHFQFFLPSLVFAVRATAVKIAARIAANMTETLVVVERRLPILIIRLRI